MAKVALLSALRSKLADRPSYVVDSEELSEDFRLLLTPYMNSLKSRMRDMNMVANAAALESVYGDMFGMDNVTAGVLLNSLCGLEASQDSCPPPPPALRSPTQVRRGSMIRRGSGSMGSATEGSSQRKSSNATSARSASFVEVSEVNSILITAKAIDFKSKLSLSSLNLVVKASGEMDTSKQNKSEATGEAEGGRLSETIHPDQSWLRCKEIVSARLQQLEKTRESITPRDPTNSHLVLSQVYSSNYMLFEINISFWFSLFSNNFWLSVPCQDGSIEVRLSATCGVKSCSVCYACSQHSAVSVA